VLTPQQPTSERYTAPVTHGGLSAGVCGGIVVSAVMPCLNEQETLGLCIEKAFRSFAELGVAGEVIVADNGSTDQSANIARNLGARVVHEQTKGYGAALRTGILESRGEIIVMADADDSYDWSAIAPLVRKVQEGFDLVMGNRFKGGIMTGAMPRLHRYLGNPILSLIARTAFRVPIGDFHCGMRAFTRNAFDRMQLRTSGMEFATEMVANAAHQRLRIAEVPIVLYPDKRNRPPHLRSFRDGWRHLRFILTYAPDHLYLTPGFILLAIGLMLEAILLRGPVVLAGQYFGIHFLALGCMLTLAGFNILNLGVVAKAVMAQRYEGIISHTVNVMRKRYALETSVIIGSALAVGGFVCDAAIASRWLSQHTLPMDATVHLAFVAATAFVLGLSVIFSSFLLNLILADSSPG
jgi:glycosyltransferase involved in cell wall biosynthesis